MNFIFFLLQLSITASFNAPVNNNALTLSQSSLVDSMYGHQTDVVNIYPTTSRIPVNLLRFYIEFSEPMREGNFLQYIRLSDENGMDLTGVFFDNQYELWNQDFTKLTVLIDPGRVKTGLAAHEKMGRAFEVGKKYTLTIDENWPTIAGATLGKSFSKQFVGASEIMRKLDHTKWEYQFPEVASKTPLKISFGQALDHISAQRYVVIVDPENKRLKVAKELITAESELLIFPKSAWIEGNYKIVVNSRMEDIVGNNMNGAFDHKVGLLQNEQEGLPIVISFSLNQSAQ